jgi:hypothetical protein
MSDFENVIGLMDQADRLMDRADAVLARQRGGKVDSLLATANVARILRKADGIAKKLSKYDGKDFTPEQIATVNERAAALSEKYGRYAGLLAKAGEIAKKFAAERRVKKDVQEPVPPQSSNRYFNEITSIIKEAGAHLSDADEEFDRMSRGGIVNTVKGTSAFLMDLHKAHEVFARIAELSKQAGDSFTDEEAGYINDRARVLTGTYIMYKELIDQSNKVAMSIVTEAPKQAVTYMASTLKAGENGLNLGLKNIFGRKQAETGNHDEQQRV